MSTENKETEFENKNDKYSELDRLKFWRVTFIVVTFTIVLAIKLWQMDFSNIEIDITTFLSISLAFFAIWLSTIFYFKADESSNRFYYQVHQFTENSGKLLSTIEAGFGEKLDGIKENIRSFSNVDSSELKKEKEKLEKQLNEAKIKEKDLTEKLKKTKKDINTSINKVELEENSKKELLDKINQFINLNNELRNSEKQINKLNQKKHPSDNLLEDFYNYIKNILGEEFLEKLIKDKNTFLLSNALCYFAKNNTPLSSFLGLKNKDSIDKMVESDSEYIFKKLNNYLKNSH